MLNLDLRKIYKFVPVAPTPDPTKLPVGAMFYYECLDCEGVVSSVPLVASKCPCGNLSGNGGKLEVRDSARLRVMTGKLK